MLIKPQFFGVVAEASNIGRATGNYTEEMFHADFPQFFHSVGGVSTCWVPASILAEFICMANSSIQPDKWCETWRYACGLLVAHNATLYLKGFGGGESDSPQAAAASGDVIGTVKSATLGDASVSYDDGSATMATEGWGDLNATRYGQLLATRARLVGMGGSYVV